MENTGQTGRKSSRPRKWRWRLAVALLGAALISHAGAAAEVKQFQDGQGTLHITNPGGAESGKAGTGPETVRGPERHSPKVAPAAPLPPQAQEAPPEPASAPSQVKATPPEPAAAPQVEEGESPETVITFPLQEAKSPAGSTEEEASAFEPQPRSGRSIGRSGGGGGGGMRGRR